MEVEKILEWVGILFIVIAPWVHAFYRTHLEHKERVEELKKENKVN